MQWASALLSSVACLVLHIFPNYLKNGKHLKKKLLKIRVLIFSTILSVTFLSQSKKNWPRCDKKCILGIM